MAVQLQLNCLKQHQLYHFTAHKLVYICSFVIMFVCWGADDARKSDNTGLKFLMLLLTRSLRKPLMWSFGCVTFNQWAQISAGKSQRSRESEVNVASSFLLPARACEIWCGVTITVPVNTHRKVLFSDRANTSSFPLVLRIAWAHGWPATSVERRGWSAKQQRRGQTHSWGRCSTTRGAAQHMLRRLAQALWWCSQWPKHRMWT